MDIVGSNEGLSSRTEVFSKTGAPKNFAESLGKNLCVEVFFLTKLQASILQLD